MARISDIEPEKHDDSLIMDLTHAKQANEYYKEHQIGFEVNDGKYIKFIDDNAGGNK